MKFYLARQNPQKIVSSLLVIWLSGFVFLFCCGTVRAQAQKDFCPLSKAKKHCDKSETGDSKTSLARTNGGESDCCSFLSAVYDKARKIESNHHIAVVSDKVQIGQALFSFVKNEYSHGKKFYSPIFHQNKIFIKNCAFRI